MYVEHVYFHFIYLSVEISRFFFSFHFLLLHHCISLPSCVYSFLVYYYYVYYLCHVLLIPSIFISRVWFFAQSIVSAHYHWQSSVILHFMLFSMYIYAIRTIRMDHIDVTEKYYKLKILKTNEKIRAINFKWATCQSYLRDLRTLQYQSDLHGYWIRNTLSCEPAHARHMAHGTRTEYNSS